MQHRWTAFGLLVLLALSGCTSSPPEADGPLGAQADAGPDAGPRGRGELISLRFASGDFEATQAFEATFSSLDACLITCTPTATQTIDLTSLVPSAAPVELAIRLDGTDNGMTARLVYDQASASRESSEYQATSMQLAALVVRDTAGMVALQLTHILPLSPSAEPVTVAIEVRAVVRSDQLLPALPAALQLGPGDRLAIAGANVTQAILIGPDGSVQRSDSDSLNLTLPPESPRGLYALLVTGGPATVAGPNTTMTARRLGTVVGDWQPMAMGAEASWEFTPPGVPLQAGVIVRSQDDSTSPMPFVGPYRVSLTGPDGTLLVEGENPGCDTPVCQGGAFWLPHSTAFLDGRLKAGEYRATAFLESGDSVQAAGFYTTILMG